ncbi:MAG: bifunctional diaminohydroxyphosphoribosylaminopyrimidine deaminase/5-amino-6-(5-phosphoribosylamino)uracil reductase RibD [Rhodospirillales bacterium]|nr:MAG: bifunctional diaminohydroxyphosphoribosylaminopyrimidine deaminase/5-amino-6-(5-phosphoribosylamino)uracil reductase RibD [Rhodospirillales bacterium]
MLAAMGLARRGLGRVWPNPAVGAVVVRDGTVTGRGWTQPGGRPHAETEALGRAGETARGATLYVTLEPCNHVGGTPPCTQAVIAAGIRHVVVAITDPDPRVAGRGLTRLREAGLSVELGICESEAAEVNAGFFLCCTAGRPLITLKTATSLDGRIATASGESRWITGDAARREAHRLRATHDAVLIGADTALVDDPDLRCRLPGMGDRSPVRVVADGRLRLPLDGRVVATANEIPTRIVTRADADPDKRSALEQRGVRVIPVETDADGRLRPAAIAGALGWLGVTRVLIEGGGRLAAAFLAAGLVDRVAWFHGPRVLGGDGVAAVAPLGRPGLASAPTFRRTGTRVLGDDVLETFERSR